jgi:diguanylate cyclase (GGDEF)-like protein
MALHVDRDNRLWVGTRNGGLDRLDPATGLFENFRHDPAITNSLSSNSVTSIHSDGNGIMWVGTYGGGLNRFDPKDGEFTVYRHDAADNTTLSSDRILDIFRDRAGGLWVGTEDGGLNRFDEADGTFVRYTHDAADASSLGSNAAWDILESRDGALWVATMGGGLNHWDTGNRAADRPVFRKYLKASGLRSDTMFGIVEDEDGFLWVSSNRGLSRFNPADGSVRNFDRFNGLRGDEFNFGPHLQTGNGRLLFGGPTGIVSFHPDELLVNRHTPDIFLTASSRSQLLATTYSAEQAEPETIKLGYDEDYIQFKFAALDYASSDKNQYRFKLDGFDEDWVDPGEIRRAIYTSLPAGDYVFTVKASNNDGIWNNQGASIKLHVEPPPWQTPFAYTMYTLFLGGTLIGYRRKQDKKFKKVADRNEALESEVDVRTQELFQSNEQLKLLNEKLLRASVTDSLTGLHNRRFLDEIIDTEIARVDRRLEGGFVAESNSNTVSISPALFFMMIDLDGFKGINDVYGHLAGDRALVQVRDLLRKSCRASDTIIRWGGDEFMVIGNIASPRSLERLAERIRANLADHQYELGGGNVGRLSASVGFSMYPFSPRDPKSATWEQIVSFADSAAYVAKRNGRNAWVGVYGSGTGKWQDHAKTGVDVPALARQGVIDIRSSLETIEESPGDERQEKA